MSSFLYLNVRQKCISPKSQLIKDSPFLGHGCQIDLEPEQKILFTTYAYSLLDTKL